MIQSKILLLVIAVLSIFWACTKSPTDSHIIHIYYQDTVKTNQSVQIVDTILTVDDEYFIASEYLKIFFLFQDSLPPNPYIFSSPESLFSSVNEPYTRYIPKNKSQGFLNSLTTQKSGIGVVLDSISSGYVVKQVVPNSPAKQAGILELDTIIAVEGQSVIGITFAQIRELIQGETGTPRQLTVKRGNLELSIAPVLGSFLSFSVFSDEIDANIASIQITGFLNSTAHREGTAGEFIDALEKTAYAKYTILDLRGNPGGILNQSIKVASQFVDGEKSIANFRQRVTAFGEDTVFGLTMDTVYKTQAGGVAPNRKFVALVDHGTASAAELLVSFLRDQKNVQVFGITTFGKARGQVLPHTPKGGIAKITFAKISPISGKEYDEIGIVPDFVSNSSEETPGLALEWIAQQLNATSAKQKKSTEQIAPAQNKIRLRESPIKEPLGIWEN